MKILPVLLSLLPPLSRERQALMFPHIPSQSSVSYSRKLLQKGHKTFFGQILITCHYEEVHKVGKEGIFLIKDSGSWPLDDYSNRENWQNLKCLIYLDMQLGPSTIMKLWNSLQFPGKKSFVAFRLFNFSYSVISSNRTEVIPQSPQPTSSTSPSLTPPLSPSQPPLMTNVTAPVNSTARLHCSVSNVDQEQVSDHHQEPFVMVSLQDILDPDDWLRHTERRRQPVHDQLPVQCPHVPRLGTVDSPD